MPWGKSTPLTLSISITHSFYSSSCSVCFPNWACQLAVNVNEKGNGHSSYKRIYDAILQKNDEHTSNETFRSESKSTQNLSEHIITKLNSTTLSIYQYLNTKTKYLFWLNKAYIKV